MKEKKNIDRLFQEKFKDFEAHPSSSVWQSIVAAQEEKDDRKIIPLWWKLGGIAAGLLLIFGIATLVTSDQAPSNNAPALVDQNSKEESTIDTSEIPLSNQSDQSSQSDIVSTDDNDLEEDKTSKDNVTNNSQKSFSKNTSSSAVVTSSDEGVGILNNNQQRNGITQPSQSPPLSSQKEAVVAVNKQDTKTAISTYGTKDTYPSENNDNKDSNKVETTRPTEGLAVVIANKDADQQKILYSGVITPEDSVTSEKDLVAEAQKIAASKNDEQLPPEDPLYKEKKATDRWGVGAVAAPVYYGDFGGSGLDPAFKDNDTSGDVSLSYGVQISYDVTPKFKVRTGVSTVDLSYTTNDLSFSIGGTRTRELEGVSFSQNARGVTITDRNVRATQGSDGVVSGAPGSFSNGSLQQRLSYIEVPMEAVYTVSDKRLGIAVIGGVSTLVLNDNDVILLSEDINTSLGTSNSVNDISFTTNIGLGLDYKITDEFKFNLEPALKYQINGFDDAAGEFKPYFLGVYTGVSYKF